jgi:tRNA threonylcarbamoyladenosine biosynthesis protein TsaE
MPSFALSDLEATERLAAALAAQLRDGDVVELHGEMGAGKTTFTGAVARALGSVEPARSPTYTIAHSYQLADGRTMAHLDCYRQLGCALDDEAWGDLEPYFVEGIAFVEWPEPIRPRLLQHPTWVLRLAFVGLDARTVHVSVPTDRDVTSTASKLAAAFV